MSIALTVTRRLLGSGVVVELPSVWRGQDLAPHQLSMSCRRILTLTRTPSAGFSTFFS